MNEREKYFIDLSKCSEEQIKHLRQIDPLIDKIEIFPYLFWDETEWNQTHLKGITGENRTELTYPDFIKLFEGGERENGGWVKIESEADLPKDSGEYFVFNGDSVIIEDFRRLQDGNKKMWLKLYTYYQPIVKPEPPKF